MNPAVRCRESLSQFRNDLCCSHLGLAQLLSLAQQRALQPFFVRICRGRCRLRLVVERLRTLRGNRIELLRVAVASVEILKRSAHCLVPFGEYRARLVEFSRGASVCLSFVVGCKMEALFVWWG